MNPGPDPNSKPSDASLPQARADSRTADSGRRAELIVNADDWGRDEETTTRILDCFRQGSISSVSAMVFMKDSECGAEIALAEGIDAGLHLNFTLGYSNHQRPAKLAEHQQRIVQTLLRHRWAGAMYYPWLAASFDYVVKAQIEEFERQYGASPARIDGHHHMHLCANVLGQRLLPKGIVVRRNLSFAPGEKSWLNRCYRARQDRRLARDHRMADFFFDLLPVKPASRLQNMRALAERANVEVETHPARGDEYNFLMDGGLMVFPGAASIARGYVLCDFKNGGGAQ